ncbi:hypothetical protein GJ633_03365 [Halorubrum sp. CBA1125]|uniref:hypothetical protein n=1 Tax=Halorubrum sp. CBA1125 TaxID=2668072 RepID=UPI0012E8E4DF|nr:hypothetical protein [Halorubrum sp. CBA1125]MUW13808.1 hypothetical protein [Halorubrum sp. CBA1125]
MNAPEATRVVLSYPDGLSDWGRSQVDTDRFRGYFRRVLGRVAVGDVREEFVDVGCCGDSLDVPFRVERVEVDGEHVDREHVGGETSDTEAADVATVTDETTVAYTTRPGDVEGGWRVQSAAGPACAADPEGQGR